MVCIPMSLRVFQFIVIHMGKGFGVVSKAEVDAFLELSCFFDDPMDAGNLISGSSSFSVLPTFCLFSSVHLPFVTLFNKYLLNIYFWFGTVYISRSLCPPAAYDLVTHTCIQVKSVKIGLLSSAMTVYGRAR